jgi:integrase/recombinase XerD
MHAATVAVLSDYAARRDAHLGTPRSPYFFVAEQGGRLLHQYVHRVLATISASRVAAGGTAQRPTDSRSAPSFAVQTLINWYRAGEDVEREIYTALRQLAAWKTAQMTPSPRYTG